MTRVVVVTGGAGGVGRAVAGRFADDGARVWITGRRGGALCEAALESGATAVLCDVARPEGVEGLLSQIPAQIDVLINVAGGNERFTTDDPTSLTEIANEWHANIDGNVLSAVLTTTAIQERMPPGSAVVSVGSLAADRTTNSYGAAKAALQAWSAGLAVNLGTRDITVNTIAPGFIEGTGYFQGQLSGGLRTQLQGVAANGRACRPADVADLAFFLASPAARHITGQTLHLDGGAHTTR